MHWDAACQRTVFKPAASPGLFAFVHGASVWQGRSSICAVSRQRQVVALFLCAGVETAGLTYSIRQHCDTGETTSTGSGCVSRVFKNKVLFPNIFWGHSTLFKGLEWSDLCFISATLLDAVFHFPFLLKAQIFLFFFPVSCLIANIEDEFRFARQKKPTEQVAENLGGLFAWTSWWNEQCAGSHARKLIKV